MRTALAMMAAAALVGCGAEIEDQQEQPEFADASVEQQPDSSTVEPITVSITSAVGSVPEMGGANYQIDVSVRASKQVACTALIACDGSEIVRDGLIIWDGNATTRFYLHDGVPACSSRTIGIECPGGSANAQWTAL